MTGLLPNGIYPPLTTPFNRSGELDASALAENVARYNEIGFAGYVALGSNGEAVHMDADERSLIVSTVKRNAAPPASGFLIAGVNEQSTRAAKLSIRRAADAGADAALVITPYFYKGNMNQAALAGHFRALADDSPIPILIYNIPQNTGVVIDPPTVAALADHERVIGIKDSSGNFIASAAMIRLTPPNFSVLVGSGAIVYPALMMGAAGAILALACIAGQACVDLYKSAIAGDHQKARDLQNRLTPVSNAVTSEFGVAGLKAALDMLGYAGRSVRQPLSDLGEHEKKKLETVLKNSGLFPEFS